VDASPAVRPTAERAAADVGRIARSVTLSSGPQAKEAPSIAPNSPDPARREPRPTHEAPFRRVSILKTPRKELKNGKGIQTDTRMGSGLANYVRSAPEP
jgi:hypothetical protein